jgi:TPR repeat protein
MPRDPAESYVWFSLAAKTDYPNAKMKADLMKQQLTSAQILEADQRIANWRARSD